MKGNVEEEKKIESTIYDQHYSERETKRLVKKAGTTDGSPSKLNEDIPVDIKELKKVKRVKKAGNRDSSRLEKAHKAQPGRSSSKLIKEAESPKQKFQALKSKYIKLNDHLKSSELQEA